MKITAQEEYGLRILIRIARCVDKDGMSIPQLSEAEGLGQPYVAKISRLLRIGGFINSTPGQKGGYILSKPADQININNVLKTLGGALFDKEYCDAHIGTVKLCTNSVDCSARSLWRMVQYSVDQVLNKVTLAELTGNEKNSVDKLMRALSLDASLVKM
jgi:Rrf2 family protein